MNAKDWNNKEYKANGLNSQRKYPNEELIRFLYRTGKGKKVLDIGCGNGVHSDLLLEFYDDYIGIDISDEVIKLLKNTANKTYLKKDIINDEIDFKFDCIIDCFSMYCMDNKDYYKAMKNCHNILNNGGKMFVFTPSQHSSYYQDYKISSFFYDKDQESSNVLDGIKYGSFYAGNDYSFRFTSLKESLKIYKSLGFKVNRYETLTRSAKNMSEFFQWFIFDLTKGE